MKNLIFFILAVFALLSSCKDRSLDSDVLPDTTQNGANTGGALIDGNIWVAKNEYPDLNPGGNNTQYEHVNGRYNLQIVLRNIENPSGDIITIKISSNVELSTENYQLYNSDNNGGFYFISPEGYVTDTNYTGSLKLIKIDKVNKIVSGTFSFKAKNSNGKIINITDGRFDKKFL